MTGLSKDVPTPTAILVHQKSRELEIAFGPSESYRFPFEFLRVYSPSAEVRGHGPGQETLQVGQRDVTIQTLEPVGRYAIKPIFSDGHDTGIYSWDYLYWLGKNQAVLWEDYLARLNHAGASRSPEPAPGPFVATPVRRL